MKFIGCPTVLRCDHGTENSLITTAQISFRMFHEDTLAAEKSVIYGASTANTVCIRQYRLVIVAIYFNNCCQRIEGWWSQLRRSKTHWWIDCFRVTAAALIIRL